MSKNHTMPPQESTAAAPQMQQTNSVVAMTEPLNPFTSLTERIGRRAYSVWLERGCKDGHPLEDWLQAQAEILAAKKRHES